MMVRTNRTDRFVFYDTPASDPEQLHTPVCDWNGRTVHFINDAKYTTDLSEDWKNYWVKLKVKFKLEIPPGTTIPENVRLILYIYDPDGDQSGFSEPTNLYAVFKLNHFGRTGLDGKDCDDNQPEGGVFRSDKCWSGFDLRDIPEATVEPPNAGYSYIDFMPNYNFGQLNISLAGIKDKIVSNGSDHELTVYFRTCRHGGNNYRIKDIIGVPSCFRWYELTEQNGAVKPLEVWKKYPVFFTGLTIDDTVYNVQYTTYTWDFIGAVQENLIGVYDDTFCYVYPYIPGAKQLNGGTELIMNEHTNFVDWYRMINQKVGYHTRSADLSLKNNVHVILYPEELFAGGGSREGVSSWYPDILGNSGDTNEPTCIVEVDQGNNLIYDLKINIYSYRIIHELGHTIGHLEHWSYCKPDIIPWSRYVSVMNEPPFNSTQKGGWENNGYTYEDYPYDYLDNRQGLLKEGRVLWFHKGHNFEMRFGANRQSSDKGKYFYYWRSKP